MIHFLGLDIHFTDTPFILQDMDTEVIMVINLIEAMPIPTILGVLVVIIISVIQEEVTPAKVIIILTTQGKIGTIRRLAIAIQLIRIDTMWAEEPHRLAIDPILL